MLINSGKRFWEGLFESFGEVHCEFCQRNLEILPIKKVVPDSIWTNDQMIYEFSESALVLPETEHIKNVDGLFSSPHGLL